VKEKHGMDKQYEVYEAADGYRYVGYVEATSNGHEDMVPVYGPFVPGEVIPDALLDGSSTDTTRNLLFFTVAASTRVDNPWYWTEHTTSHGNRAVIVSNVQTGETIRFTFMKDYTVLVTDENTGEYIEGGQPSSKYDAFLKYVQEGGEKLS
jgi:hypothetical protein